MGGIPPIFIRKLVVTVIFIVKNQHDSTNN